jgi:predicted transcriptional regulator
MAKEYRSRSRILLDVLRGVRDEGEAGVTRLLLLANLSHPRLTEYLKELEDKGWVVRVEEGKRSLWKVTDEGVRVIGELSRVERMMQDFGLDF